ncbi:cytochrome P450 [Sphaerospermopsis sp. LEGE 00249]|uniref:cytochrome P450 n=1 Tax=Sphaerospermopsis sp. LEGE 00249 TaxID=1380707 RepID=UPI002104DB72|nr:cytochrome P450 [Sphaerospermopsis sp. LEGE 00249]
MNKLMQPFMSDNKLPDGPEDPELFQLINWLVRPLEYLEECVEKYGDMFTMRPLGFPPLVFIGHPQGIKDIFSTYAKSFDTGTTDMNAMLHAISGDRSVAVLDGFEHKRERKLLMPPFHGDRLKLYANKICEITDNVTSKCKINKPFIARDVIEEITLKILMHIVFGFSTGEKSKQFISVITDWIDQIDSPVQSSLLFLRFLQVDLGAWSPWGNFVRSKQSVDQLLQAEIEYRRTNKEKLGDDIFSLLLEATYEDGQTMSDDQVKHELMSLLYAGYETTATALAWAFYWLEQYPRVKRKLLQEIDSLGKNPDPIEISQLPYLTAVCQETLRIYPTLPFAFGRTAKQDMEIMGRLFKAGTTFYPSIYSVHHQEDLYPNSKQFRPERFLERQYTPYEFIPFGGGPRICVGYALAMLEMKLVIASIVSKYNLKIADDQPVKPERHFSSIAPSNGVPLVLTGFR